MIILRVEDEEWFTTLVEELKDIKIQAYKRSSEELLRGYYDFGRRLLEENNNFERHSIYGAEITKRVSQSLGTSQRTVEKAVQFAKKFSDFEDIYKLEEGESINWHKLSNKYLPDGNGGTIKELTCECPKCHYVGSRKEFI